MKAFNQKKFNKFLIQQKVVGFFEQPITLKSGRLSYWYANCRNLLDYAGVMDKLIDFIHSFSNEKALNPDYFYGVPEGATKFALILNYKRARLLKNKNYPLIIGRGKPKEHGDPKDKYYIGPIKEGQNVVVLEDVTTTGGSLIDAIAALREAKVNVVAAVGLVNRMEKRDDGLSVEEKLKEINVPYYAMSDAFQMLPLAVKSYKPSPEIIAHVEEGFKQYGVSELKLRK